MFSIIISEKGGAERREVYDRTEINIGRVQGNDLMLPKGNVSKRHARLLFRDGRFIVTDLKSTNGTYVNGRKIAQATIVREGDKIYIGDFVLKIEPSEAASAAKSSENNSPSSPERQIKASAAPRIEDKPASEGPASPSPDGVSHFPLEQDPDDSVPQYAVPGPPRVPSGGRTAPPPMPTAPPGPPAPSAPPPGPATSPPASPGRSLGAPTTPPGHPSQVPAPSPSAIPISSKRQHTGDRISTGERPSVDSSALAAHREALAAVVEQIGQQVDLTPLDGGEAPSAALKSQVEQQSTAAAGQLRSAGKLPEGLSVESLAAQANAELLAFGPLTDLLEDEDVLEVQVVRHDYVVARHAGNQVAAEVSFSSESAVARVIRRLCLEAGQPVAQGESFIERRLSTMGGTALPVRVRLFAVVPPASEGGHVLVLRKAQRGDVMLDDLVRAGTVSRGIATLLSCCVAARANILITGSLGAGAPMLLGACAAAGNTDDRVILLQEDEDLILNQPHSVSLPLGDTAEAGARAVRAAVRIRPDRLIVGAFAGHVASEVVDSIGDGIDGVLAAARAPTLRQLVSRLPADIAATRGISVETAREWLGSAFDLVIEVARLKDGRRRVMRVSDLLVQDGKLELKDVFTFNVERTAAGGTLEGTFHPTGYVPAIAEDLNARGSTMDTSIFRRSAR